MTSNPTMTQVPDSSMRFWLMRSLLLLRRYFLTGLVSVLPIVVTVALLSALFQFADGLLGRWINRYWERAYGYSIPGLGLLVVVLLIVGTGIVSQHFLGRRIVRRLEAWLSTLPILRDLLPYARRLSDFLLGEGPGPSRPRVVLIEYPRRGAYALAVVTNESFLTHDQATRPLCILLLAHAHSPWMSPMVFIPREDVIPLDLSIQDVLTFTVSGGVVGPSLQVLRV